MRDGLLLLCIVSVASLCLAALLAPRDDRAMHAHKEAQRALKEASERAGKGQS